MTPLLAEAALPGPSTQVFVDPTTSTPFPHRLVAPDGKTHLRLVGTGVRTVSFLNIRVYTAAFYVSEPELDAALAGKLAGWEAYAPERLLPPPLKKSTAGGEGGALLRGEQLMDTLLEKADTAVIISAFLPCILLFSRPCRLNRADTSPPFPQFPSATLRSPTSATASRAPSSRASRIRVSQTI